MLHYVESHTKAGPATFVAGTVVYPDMNIGMINK
jgi:hypothetical protein